MKFKLPYTQILALCTLLIFAASCQRATSTEEEAKSYQVVVLLASERATLDDVELLKNETIVKKNRSSRSQNQWQVELKKKPSDIDEYLKQLNASPQVKSAKLSGTN